MRKLHRLALSLSFIVLITSCKKDEVGSPSKDESPSCPVSNSLPVKVEYTNSLGFKVTREYKYDALNRAIQITNYDSLYTLDISYKGSDTAVYSMHKTSSTYLIQRVNNSWGEHVETNQTFFSLAGDTTGSNLYLYSYDGSHQIHSVVTYRYSYNNGRRSLSPPTIDSSIYQWEDGNVIKILGYAANPNGVFEYLPNTNGLFQYNIPGEAANFLHDFTAKPVLSRNLVSKHTLSNGQVRTYHYKFDGNGRVTEMIVEGNIGYLTGTHKFFYKCI